MTEKKEGSLCGRVPVRMVLLNVLTSYIVVKKALVKRSWRLTVSGP